MPRSIQMGTTPPNKLCQPPAPLPPLTPPDLLSGMGASQHSSDTSVTSRDTVTTYVIVALVTIIISTIITLILIVVSNNINSTIIR